MIFNKHKVETGMELHNFKVQSFWSPVSFLV